MIKSVIFDIGGVLAYDVWEHLFFDSPDGIVTSLNLDYKRVYEVASPIWNNFSYRAVSDAEECDELELECWRNFTAGLNLSHSPYYFIELTDHFIRPVDGMRELLHELHSKQIDLLICSNNNEFFFKRQMTRLGLTEFFPDTRKIVLSSRSGVPKSDPSYTMFKDVINALECSRQEALFIDDREENIQRALECNIPTLLFPSEAAYGADYLRTLLGLLKVL